MSAEVEEEEELPAVTLPDEIAKIPDFIVPHTEEVAKESDVQIAGTSPAMTSGDDYKFETTDDFLAELEDAAASNQPVANEDNYNFETTDDFLKDLEEAAEKSAEKTAKGKTKTIIIISSVTIAAALAAGIIIFGKRKREEESK